MNTEILLGVGMFTAIIMVLVTVILMARKQLVAAGAVDIEINGDPEKTLSTAAGG
jgi:Na+-transporting NADH:ubiquinone oxidoreductase subunit F